MTLLTRTKLQHQKMRVLPQVYRFLLPVIPGSGWASRIISKGQMLSSVRAWNLLAEGELSDAVLLTAMLRRSREKMVHPSRRDSLKQ